MSTEENNSNYILFPDGSVRDKTYGTLCGGGSEFYESLKALLPEIPSESLKTRVSPETEQSSKESLKAFLPEIPSESLFLGRSAPETRASQETKFMTLSDIEYELSQEHRCIACAYDQEEIITELRKTYYSKLKDFKEQMIIKNLKTSHIPYKTSHWGDIKFWSEYLKTF